MVQYVDKDALVAEIDNMLNTKEHTSHSDEVTFNSGRWKALKKVKDILDTLEVKGVDLQEEPKTDWLQELQDKIDSLSKEDFEKVMAKYRRYGEEGSVDYDKLNTMLDESLSTETKESWNDRLGEEPVSMWHDVSEKPKPNTELICVGQYGNPLVLSSNSNSFKERYISKWAYFNDLLNLSSVYESK